MSFFFEPAQVPANGNFADGVATNSELFSAAHNAAATVDNFNAQDGAREFAYDKRNDAIFKATGVRLDNPVRRLEVDMRAHNLPSTALSDYNTQLANLQNQHPDLAHEIRAHIPIQVDAEFHAKQNGIAFDTAMASRDDFASKWTMVLGGGFTGGLRDPVQVGGLFLGGGVGAGRSATTRILGTAVREAAVNGAFEAAQQPIVQAWRKQVGLPNGFNEGLRNTLTAAGFAGILGGGAQGVSELVGKLLRDLPAEHVLKRADEGDVNAQVEVLRPLADTLSPEQKGALAAAETDQALAAARPAHIDVQTHDDAVGKAIGMAEDPASMAVIEVKPRRAQSELKRPLTVTEFIAAQGGLRDEGAELSSRGITSRSSFTRNGPFMRKASVDGQGKGLSPDAMREALVEAGYLRDEGAATGGVSTTTPEDVYRLIDEQLSGKRVVAEQDMSWQAELDSAAQHKQAINDFKAQYGDDAWIAAQHGTAIADEALLLRKDGVSWTRDDLEWAADWHGRFPHETARVAIDEAVIQRMMRQAETAASLDTGVAAADKNLPPMFEDEINGQTDQVGRSGQPLQGAGSTGDGQGRTGTVAGQPEAGGTAGSAPSEGSRGLGAGPAIGKPEGGVDLVNAPEVVAMTDATLATLKADTAAMAREIWAEFPDGSGKVKRTFAQLLDEADRPAHLSQLVEACKAV
jgi:hypothetical protein